MTLMELTRHILVPDCVLKKSISFGALSVEQCAKLAAGASAGFFAMGVTCTAVSYALVSLPPFEPLKVQQVFLGLVFFLHTSIAFVIPARKGTRSLLSWLIQFVALALLLIDSSVINQISYYLGAHIVHLNDVHFSVLVGRKANGLMLFIAAAAVFRLLRAWLAANANARPFVTFGGLFVAVVTSLAAFAMIAYPRIPLALGGGALPVVQIHFVEDAPYVLTSEFDISQSNPQYIGFRHYAHLVHQTSDTLYLSSPFWFSSDVVEVKRKYVLMLKFGDFNPTEWILPYNIQE